VVYRGGVTAATMQKRNLRTTPLKVTAQSLKHFDCANLVTNGTEFHLPNVHIIFIQDCSCYRFPIGSCYVWSG